MSFSIETIKEYGGRGFKCALFDFDGTISLIREGWQKVMIPYFCEVIEALGTNEDKDAICDEVTEFVDRLTGKQTIFQCIALDEAVVRRGGNHIDPGEYKKEYLRRLEMRIADRKNGLESGSLSPDDLAVRGSVEFIKALRNAGIRCFLASGTDEEDVIYEASLIGVKDLRRRNSRRKGRAARLLERGRYKNMIEERKLDPEELVTFGDGFVEIELTAKLGGFAVGVATNEKTGDGTDEKKRARLMSAGADMIIPHFEDTEALLKALHI